MVSRIVPGQTNVGELGSPGGKPMTPWKVRELRQEVNELQTESPLAAHARKKSDVSGGPSTTWLTSPYHNDWGGKFENKLPK
jgi:hypothetical protein